jgi:quercetin dioxygenase-like cupin family protein
MIMRQGATQWVVDRKLKGVEHKQMGAFGEHRSAIGLHRLAPGARIPAHVHEDAEILYFTAGSITYDGRTWQGGTSQDVGTYMFIPHGTEVKDIATETGATAFFIALPMLADIEAARKASGDEKKLAAGAYA